MACNHLPSVTCDNCRGLRVNAVAAPMNANELLLMKRIAELEAEVERHRERRDIAEDHIRECQEWQPEPPADWGPPPEAWEVEAHDGVWCFRKRRSSHFEVDRVIRYSIPGDEPPGGLEWRPYDLDGNPVPRPTKESPHTCYAPSSYQGTKKESPHTCYAPSSYQGTKKESPDA